MRLLGVWVPESPRCSAGAVPCNSKRQLTRGGFSSGNGWVRAKRSTLEGSAPRPLQRGAMSVDIFEGADWRERRAIIAKRKAL